jgi:hypothetical protein
VYSLDLFFQAALLLYLALLTGMVQKIAERRCSILTNCTL